MLKTGTKAPIFKLNSTPDQRVSLSQLKSQKIVLLFYPADWSPICSNEFAIFNAATNLLEKYNAVVMTISVDNVWSHDAFAKKQNLHFPLLSDFEPKEQIAMRYDMYNKKVAYANALFIL